MMRLIWSALSVKEELPSFLCSLPPLIFDICWTESWPSPGVHGNSSSACFFPGTVHLDWVKQLWVVEQLWVGKVVKNKILSFSPVMAPFMAGIMDVLGAREGEKLDKGSDSLGPENLPCFHLNNHFWLPPLPTLALLPVQTKTSVHQSCVGVRPFSTFLSNPLKSQDFFFFFFFMTVKSLTSSWSHAC